MNTRIPRAAQVAADLFKTHWWMAALFWLSLYVAFSIISVIVHFASTLDQRAWIGARYWPQYIVLAFGVMLSNTQLRLYVGNGVSRRAFFRGGIVYGLAMAAVSGICLQLGFVIERGLFNLAGIEQFPDLEDLAASPLRVFTSTLEFTSLFALYFFAGWLIASTFYRLGVMWGLTVIVASAVPAVLLEVSLWDVGPVAAVSAAVGRPVVILGLSAVFVAVLCLMNRRILRSVPISAA